MSYRDQLIMALRVRDVPGDRIGEIVAEVDSHVAENGEEPAEAFGPARDYAEQFPAPRRALWTARTVVAVLLGLVGGVLLVSSIFDLVGDTNRTTFGLASWLVFVGAVGLFTVHWALLLSLRDPLVDPLQSHDPSPALASFVVGALVRVAIVVAVIAALAAVTQLLA